MRDVPRCPQNPLWALMKTRWRGVRRGLHKAMPLVLVASILTAVTAPKPAVAAPPAKPSCPAQRPDRVSAVMAARLCGGKVEVSGEKSETLQLWANPDGTLTAQKSTGPVRMHDAKGGWQAVDPTLQADADGGVSAKAHPRGLKLAGDSGDGEHDLVRLGSGDDAMALRWKGRLPKPKLDGTRATYSDVLDGVDLVVESTRAGYEQFFVVKTQEALSRSGTLNLRFRAAGQTVSPDGSGGLVFKDKAGTVTGRMPQPTMWDATRGEHSLDPLHVGAVALSAAQHGPDIDLRLAPDPAFLASKDLQYPITIDPSVTLLFDTFVQTGYTTDQSGSTELKLGYSDDGGTWTARSYLNWDTGFLAGAHVNSATVYLWETHSWSCTAAQWNVYTTWAPNSSNRWTSQPTIIGLRGSSTQTKGYSTACNDGWVSADIPAFFQESANNSWSTTGMGLWAANETNHNGWKRFSSSEGSNPPYAVVTFNGTPQVTSQSTDPSTQCATGSGRPFENKLQPKLRAQVTDPEGSPVSATFEWWTTGGSMIGSTTVGPQASGSTFEATVPSGAFANGGTYSWRVRGTDGTTTGGFTGFCEFTVDTTEPGAAPGASSATFPENTWTGQPTGYTTGTVSTPYVAGTDTLALTGDDYHQQITLPFPVSLYGQSYSTAWVDTNGFVQFVESMGSDPGDLTALPNTNLPNAAVYVFAQDLVLDASSSIRTATTGTAPNRTFLIEWNNAFQFYDTSRRQNAEVLFTENSSTIRLNYSGIDNAYEQGSGALVGVENADGTLATQYSYDTPSLNNNTQVVFTYNAGTPPASAGTAANFTFTPSGVGDVVSYQYGVDTNPPATVVNAASLGGNATVSITPDSDGPHTLYVRSQDRAGNQSPIKAYQFNVGYGGLTSPKAGDISAGKVALTTAASPSATGVTYQWRRADTDTWQTIPAGDVSLAAGGGAVTWPLGRTAGEFPKLNWSLDSTVNAAEAGPDPLDGPLQIRALFTGGASAPVKITYDRTQASAASEDVGPGSVNLLTGNYVLGGKDVSIASYGSDLTVARSFNSRKASTTDKADLFGPGWVSTVSVDSADAPYSDLTVTGSLVQIGLPDGSDLGFTETAVSASGKTYEAQNGFQQLQLSYASSGDAYTLHDIAGNTVVFTHVTGAVADTYSPTSVTTPGVGQTTSLSWQKVTAGGTDLVRPTRMLAPVPAGVSCATLVKGCRALDFAYASTTSATGTSDTQWGDYMGRLTQVSFTAWDPDASPAGMRTVVVARYSYDSNGRLRAAWDPRLDWTDTGVMPPVTRHLAQMYDYDADGVISTLTPAAQQPWHFTYTTIPGDPGKGRLAQVSRSALTAGTASSTIVYKVPVSGTGAPYDLSAGQTARWGQTEQPTDATAIFDPGQVPNADQSGGALPASYDRAALTYMDANGRSVNSVAPGGYTSTVWYDAYGNTVRSLTAGNHARALNASTSDSAAQEAAIASTLSSVSVYSADGRRHVDEWGPEHDIVLATGSVVRGRVHTNYVYDEGAPSTGGPFDLVTTETTSVCYGVGSCVTADQRTTTTTYDWTLEEAVASTVDTGGLALTTRTGYDANTGQVTFVTQPAGGTSTNTPATRMSVYYRAGTGSGYSECDGHPEWANLVCRVQPGGQASGGPELPFTVTTYDMYGHARTLTEKTSAGILRTTTTTFDGAGRAATVAILGAGGTGQAVSTTRTVYDQASGQAVRTESLDGSGNVTGQIVRVYDTLGRITSYTDADGTQSTTEYDLLSRVSASSDGQASRTYSYDGGTERRGLPTQITDAQVGNMTATYDADGMLSTEAWPNGVNVTTTHREDGAAAGITYDQPGCGQSNCTLYTENIGTSAHGEVTSRTSSLSAQRFIYDNAGRLVTINDTIDGACVTRVQTFNAASDRTGLATYAAAAGGACQTNTQSSTASWTYDTADRVNTAGYAYDTLGRTTTVPSVDAAGPGSTTVTYHVNDMVRTQAQGSRTVTYTLDVLPSRFRSWVDADEISTRTTTNHYADDGDSPTWMIGSGGEVLRPIHNFTGVAALSSSVTGISWMITNLHGDLVAGMPASGFGLTYAGDFDETGRPHDPAAAAGSGYRWLGASQRWSDTPGGMVLMGSRLYSPNTGRFLSVDSVPGGNANPYDYCAGDAINCADVSGNASCRGSWKTTRKSWHTGITTETYNIRCRLSHFETFILLALAGLFGSVIAAGILGLVGAMVCGSFSGPPGGAVCGAIMAAIGSGVGFVLGFVATGLYQNVCTSLRGVTLRGTVVRKYHWIFGRFASVIYGYPLTPRCN